jgi:PBP1b-binding outer membrane lipoprotein LpoB
MKKLILFAAGLLLLAACSKKSTPAPAVNPNAKFVGTWSVTVDSTYITNNGVTTGSALTYNNNYIWTFKADGTGNINDGSSALIPTTYNVTNNTLVVTIATSGSLSEAVDFTVVSITSDKMELSYTVNGALEKYFFTKE